MRHSTPYPRRLALHRRESRGPCRRRRVVLGAPPPPPSGSPHSLPLWEVDDTSQSAHFPAYAKVLPLLPSPCPAPLPLPRPHGCPRHGPMRGCLPHPP